TARRHARVKYTSGCRSRRQGLEIGPDTAGEPGEKCRTERRRFEFHRSLDRRLDDVSKKLAKPVVYHHAAIDAHCPRVPCAFACHRRGEIQRLKGHGLERRPYDVRAIGIESQATDKPARIGLPVRSAESDEC